MKKIIFSFLVLLVQVAYSQTSKNFGDFSAVKVYDRINVTLVKSSENKIQVKGDDPDVEIVNKNGELKIPIKTGATSSQFLLGFCFWSFLENLNLPISFMSLFFYIFWF